MASQPSKHPLPPTVEDEKAESATVENKPVFGPPPPPNHPYGATASSSNQLTRPSSPAVNSQPRTAPPPQTADSSTTPQQAPTNTAPTNMYPVTRVKIVNPEGEIAAEIHIQFGTVEEENRRLPEMRAMFQASYPPGFARMIVEHGPEA